MKPIIMWMKIMVVNTLLLEDYMHPTPQHNNALMAFKNNVYIAFLLFSRGQFSEMFENTKGEIRGRKSKKNIRCN
jgi:hypothetical protein